MLRYGDFSIFQDGGLPILDVGNFKTVMVEEFNRAKLSHCAKFRADRSNRCGGMTIFCHNGDRRHRGFIKFHNFNGQHGQDDNRHHLTKFGSDRSNHFWNMAIVRFLKMAAAVLYF